MTIAVIVSPMEACTPSTGSPAPSVSRQAYLNSNKMTSVGSLLQAMSYAMSSTAASLAPIKTSIGMLRAWGNLDILQKTTLLRGRLGRWLAIHLRLSGGHLGWDCNWMQPPEIATRTAKRLELSIRYFRTDIM